MGIEGLGVELALVIPITLVVGGLVVAFAWSGWSAHRMVAPLSGAGRVAGWFGLTTLSLFVEGLVAFVLLHGLLFTFGRLVAGIGMIAVISLMQLTPIFWAVVIRRGAAPVSAHGRA